MTKIENGAALHAAQEKKIAKSQARVKKLKKNKSIRTAARALSTSAKLKRASNGKYMKAVRAYKIARNVLKKHGRILKAANKDKTKKKGVWDSEKALHKAVKTKSAILYKKAVKAHENYISLVKAGNAKGFATY